jgi:hypothetical protein
LNYWGVLHPPSPHTPPVATSLSLPSVSRLWKLYLSCLWKSCILVSGVTEKESLGIFGVRTSVDCCHRLTEILYLYWIFIEGWGKVRVYNNNNNSFQHM